MIIPQNIIIYYIKHTLGDINILYVIMFEDDQISQLLLFDILTTKISPTHFLPFF